MVMEEINRVRPFGDRMREDILKMDIQQLDRIETRVNDIHLMLSDKEPVAVEMRATPISDETMKKLTKNQYEPEPEIPTPRGFETITHSGQPLIPLKRPYHRRKRVIEGKRLKGSEANKIMNQMHTDIVEPRYFLTLERLRGGGKTTVKQVAESIHISEWNTMAHLKYGVAIKDISSSKKRRELQKYWITRQGEEKLTTPAEAEQSVDPTTKRLQEIAKERGVALIP
jgi:hypothetical protein